MEKKRKTKKGINPKADFYVDSSANKIVFDLGDGTEDIVSDEIGVEKVWKNLDTQEIIVKLYHKTVCTLSHFEGTLHLLGKGQIFNFLSNKGVLMNENYASSLSRYLTNKIEEIISKRKMEYIHEKLGWAREDNHQSGYLSSKSIHAAYPSTLRDNTNKIIGPNGDRTIYDKMIENEVIPNKSLHLPFVLGFVAPLVPILGDRANCPVLITNFAGKSSHGKSTSLLLISSIWGRGRVSNSKLSITKTFSSTQNAFEVSISKRNGFPVLYDDYETAPGNLNFSQLVYSLAQGESKARNSKPGTNSDTFDWRTYIGFTGESSIFDRMNKKMGLKARIVEFKNQKWTVSKENSINITSVVNNHYGFYGEEFVRKLTKISKEDLENYYDESENVINGLLPSDDNISERIQTRLALIRTAAVLVKELMEFEVDVDYITNLLVENEQSRLKGPDVYQEAFEAVVEFLNMNYASFITYDKALRKNIIPNRAIFGRIYKGRQGTLIAFLPSVINSIMSVFNDREAIFDKWKEEGFLVCDKDGRYTKMVRMNEKVVDSRCYCFSFNKITEYFGNVISSDLVELLDLENEDTIQTVGPENIKMIQGQRYVHIPLTLDKYGEIRIKEPVRNEAICDETLKSSPITLTETPICKIDYDDLLNIDEIFEEFKNRGKGE